MKSSLIHSTFELPTDHGRSIRADVRWCPAEAPRPLVVICHGFKGFKEWGFHPYFGAELAHAGFVAVSVNFSHNGVGADLISFTDREGFRANTISREAEELERVLDVAHDPNHWLSRLVDSRNIGLIGHSRAGYAVFTVGSRREDVAAIAGLAAVSELNVEPEREKRWREDGVIETVNQRTKERLPLGLPLLADLKANADGIERAMTKCIKPLLIIHGDRDDAVPVRAAHSLAAWAHHAGNNDVSLRLLPGADHVFGARQPLLSVPPDLASVTEMLVEFFTRTLRHPV